MTYIYVNGKPVPEHKAVLPVHDRGTLLGDGVFETMRAYDGHVFKLKEHLARLRAGARVIALKPPPARELEQAVLRTVRKNREKDAYVRLTVTRGSGGAGLVAQKVPVPSVFVVTRPHHGYPEKLYRTGAVCRICKTRRNEGSPVSRIKSLNYLDSILAKRELKKNETEGIMLNNGGLVACGTVSNVFFIKGRTILTPALECGVLAGITRQVVIDHVAGQAGYAVREGRIRPGDLRRYSGAFITNSTMEVMPLRRIDTFRFDPEVVRPVQDAFRGYVEQWLRRRQ